jgi:hypothetical protein
MQRKTNKVLLMYFMIMKLFTIHKNNMRKLEKNRK